MKNQYLLHSKIAKMLYDEVKNLPICDYHCHLSPKEIYENKPFDNIANMWLSADHYKWRLMRSAGVDEEYITGNASPFEKFKKYIYAVSLSPANPLYDWTKLELSMYFEIDLPLSLENAEKIYNKANEYIKLQNLSPKKLIEFSKVKYIATTDDIADNLEYHKLLRKENLSFVVSPSFRTDNLLLANRKDYKEYIEKLSKVSGVEITDISSLQKAVEKRLDYFCVTGCKMTDMGIQYFPNETDFCTTFSQADEIFKSALKGEITSENLLKFIAFMVVWLSKLYKERNLVSQWHLGVKRNVNSELFEVLGADCGCDTVGDAPDASALAIALDTINQNGGLPKTLVYTLDSNTASKYASICYAFRNVMLGNAWWFCDTKRKNIEQIHTIAENSALGVHPGMLTDSRSFLSYSRHDYFRRLLCNEIGELVEKGEYDINSAEIIVKAVSFYNAEKMTGVE